MSDFLWDHLGWFLIGGIAALIAGLVAASSVFGSAYDERQCNRYGLVSEREVQFRKFSSFSWDCYVKSRDGKIWILKDQIRDVAE